MIKAIIFDMDGVIIDSEPLWKQAIIAVMNEYGYSFDIEMCNRTKGMRVDEVTFFWKKELNETFDHNLVADQIIDNVISLIEKQGKLMEGVIQVLEQAKKSGLKISLASSSSMKLIQVVLKKLSISSYFESIHSAENEEYGKPHPQVFISTAKTLNLPPEQCLVIEDSINGVIAAKAAKMQVVAVPEKDEVNLPQFTIANKVLGSLKELKL